MAIVFVSFGVADSFAYETHPGDEMFIMVQTSLRNSDGQLITYLESTKFSYLNIPALKPFLDVEASTGNNPIISIDGERFQVIRRAQEILVYSDSVIASTTLSDKKNEIVLLARFAHDGYPVTKGDVIESIWTFVRPVS